MQFFTPITIAIATIIGFLSRSVWYSPFLFKRALLIGEAMTEKDLPKRQRIYRIQVLIYSLVIHGVIASVLALMFDLLGVSSLKVAVSLGALFALSFIVTKNFMDMIDSLHEEHWKKRLQIKFLVNSGYYIFSLSLMSLVLFLVA